ncbi:MAG: F0F1 ATP synthase subunit alpha, partial [Thermodesulfobacteriota bacterium]|nr:F0F1 ATP synthase subunit alpha [Thermodesulfobacteriota bacterium]
KQPQYVPMSLGEEVVVLFSGVRGHVDKYPVERLKDYESQMLSYVKGKYPEILKEIDEKQILSPELDEKVEKILTEFDSVFAAE